MLIADKALILWIYVYTMYTLYAYYVQQNVLIWYATQEVWLPLLRGKGRNDETKLSTLKLLVYAPVPG